MTSNSQPKKDTSKKQGNVLGYSKQGSTKEESITRKEIVNDKKQ